MALFIPNSRDIGNKFLFGHWMMKPKDGQLPFIGPGYGRVNYWMRAREDSISTTYHLDKVEADMKYMRSIGMNFYAIQLTGKMLYEDNCWLSCKGDEPGVTYDSGADTFAFTENTSYFTDKWYTEVKAKYKELIKLCRKYHLWLLNLVMNDFNWKEHPPTEKPWGKLSDWIEEYNEHRPGSDAVGSNSAGPEHGPTSRQEELKMAIEGAPVMIIPEEDDIKKLLKDVVLTCGGQSHVLVCPVNPIDAEICGLSSKGRSFETTGIKLAKAGGFATCSYIENPPGDKKGARTFQDGHQNKVADAKCKDGIGISSNGTLLYKDIYGNEDPPEGEVMEWWSCGTDTVPSDCLGNVKTLIQNYKKSSAKAGGLYAINYDKSSVDKNALDKIKEGWKS